MAEAFAREALAEAAAALSVSGENSLPAPTSAFSHADADIIEHEVQLDDALVASTAARSGSSIEALYEIPETAAKIVGWPLQKAAAAGTGRLHSKQFQHVALQFPDEMLVDSVPVFWALKKEIRRLYQLRSEQQGDAVLKEPELYILADTSYGKCVLAAVTILDRHT